MEKFPENIHASQISFFDEILFTENLNKMRKEIYLHILNRNESDFYDIDSFNRKYVKNFNRIKKMTNIIIEELSVLGWKTFLGFGETGLYIFANEKPLNAWA